MKTTKEQLNEAMDELQELARKTMILQSSENHKHIKSIREQYEKEAEERCQELHDQIQLHYVKMELEFIKSLSDGKK